MLSQSPQGMGPVPPPGGQIATARTRLVRHRNPRDHAQIKQSMIFPNCRSDAKIFLCFPLNTRQFSQVQAPEDRTL